jgi:hypothetical protein
MEASWIVTEASRLMSLPTQIRRSDAVADCGETEVEMMECHCSSMAGAIKHFCTHTTCVSRSPGPTSL